jgi:hypothetical protein
MEQVSMFTDIEIKREENKRLIISAPKKGKLSKEQLAFNKYSQKLEKLRKKITVDKVKFDKILDVYTSKVAPVQKSYGDSLSELATACYAILVNDKLSKVNKEKLSALILSNLNKAFQYIIPNQDIKTIYDALSPITYDQEEASQINDMKGMMEDMLKNQYGMDVDFSDVEMNEESLARKLAEMQELFENLEKEQIGNTQSKKKTKREIEAEAKQKQAEELQKKSVRSIYMSLAKMLHPDLESDELLKVDKEEQMKKVTAAYQDNDLHTLLKLEIEIIHKQSESLDHLTDEKLKFINSVLKDQVSELEEELDMLRSRPRYENITEFMTGTEMDAVFKCNTMALQLDSYCREIKADTLELQGTNRLRFVTPLLKAVNLKKTKDYDDMDELELEELNGFIDMIASNIHFGKKKSFKNKKRK